MVLTCIEKEKPEEVLSADQQRKSQSLNSAELQAVYWLALVFFGFEVTTCLRYHWALISNEKEGFYECVHSC